MIRGIVALAIVFALTLQGVALTLPGVARAADGDGTIEGQVINGTAGGGSVAGLEITLNRYLSGVLDDSRQIVIGQDGRFVVDDVPAGPEYYYRASLVYQGAEYFGDVAFFEEALTVTVTAVVVYDATTSGDVISVAQWHTIVQVESDQLYIIEVYSFTNTSDRTYIGADEVAEGRFVTLKFLLPENNSGLALGEGFSECCPYDSDSGFVHTMPLRPGVTDVMFSYSVPYTGDSYTFDRDFYYPTASYDLVVEGANIEIDSSRLTVATATTESGVSFTIGTATDLIPGDRLLAQVSGLPRIAGDMTVVVVVVTLLVLVAGAIIFLFIRKRTGAEVAVVAAGGPDDGRHRLLVVIAGLDDDFEGGKLPEDAYRRRREAAKAELQRLMQRIG